MSHFSIMVREHGSMETAFSEMSLEDFATALRQLDEDADFVTLPRDILVAMRSTLKHVCCHRDKIPGILYDDALEVLGQFQSGGYISAY